MRTSILLILMSLVLSSAGQADLEQLLSKTDQFLQANVNYGSVNYEGIAENRQSLNSLVNHFEDIDLSELSSNEQMAVWINAYNVMMIKAIVNHYPISSPLDVPGIFDKEKHNIGGELMTLETVEKKKLMTDKIDPRIHFVLVCAAKGCPQLADFAYRPEELDNQLNERTKKALNSNYFIRVSSSKRKVSVSHIFEWYADDFKDGGKSILDYINQYRNSKIPSSYDLDYYTYDWNLNRKK